MTVSELWQKQALQLGGDALVEFLSAIREDQQRILQILGDMEVRHTESEKAIASVVKGFPSGDIDGHRRYHEVMIENLAEKRRLRIAIQEKTVSGLVWAAAMFFGFVLVKGVPDAIHAWTEWFTRGGQS